MVENKEQCNREFEFGHAANTLAWIQKLVNDGWMDGEEGQKILQQKAEALVAKFGEEILDKMKEELRNAYIQDTLPPGEDSSIS